MKDQTRQVIALATIINGINQFARVGSKNNMSQRHMVHYQTKVIDATHFSSEGEAQEHIAILHNPHNRQFFVVTETIIFHSKKEVRDYERIQ